MELLFEFVPRRIDGGDLVEQHEGCRGRDVFYRASFQNPGCIEVGCVEEGTASCWAGDVELGWVG